MVKEFDIYLKRRITECDLIVYSLPYRDGLTATNRIILESCIESYTLQKFVAMQFGSELVSHIDKMIKTCYERLNWGTAISADAVFQTHYIMNPEASAVELAVEDIPALETMFAEAESCMILNAAPLLANIAKSLGHGHTAIAFDGGVRDTLKWGLMSPGGCASSAWSGDGESLLPDNEYRKYGHGNRGSCSWYRAAFLFWPGVWRYGF